MRAGVIGRRAVLGVLLASGCAAEPGLTVRTARPRDVTRAPASTPASSQAQEAGPAAPPPIAWRFHAGAPTSGVTIGRSGAVAVGTVDGYLHALGPEGGHRYSHVLDAPAVGAPAVLPDGGAAVLTRTGRLTVVDGEGRLRWHWRSAPAGTAGLRMEPQLGSLVIAHADGWLRALSPRGAPRWRARLPDAGALGSEDGLSWLSGDGVLLVVSPRGVTRRLAVEGLPGAAPVAGTRGGLGLVLEGALVVMDDRLAPRFRVEGVAEVAAAPDGGWWVLGADGALSLLNEAGAAAWSLVPSTAASRVRLVGRGAWVALVADHELSVVTAEGATRRYTLPASVGLSAADPSGEVLVLATGSGWLLALDSHALLGSGSLAPPAVGVSAGPPAAREPRRHPGALAEEVR